MQKARHPHRGRHLSLRAPHPSHRSGSGREGYSYIHRREADSPRGHRHHRLGLGTGRHSGDPGGGGAGGDQRDRLPGGPDHPVGKDLRGDRGCAQAPRSRPGGPQHHLPHHQDPSTGGGDHVTPLHEDAGPGLSRERQHRRAGEFVQNPLSGHQNDRRYRQNSS